MAVKQGGHSETRKGPHRFREPVSKRYDFRPSWLLLTWNSVQNVAFEGLYAEWGTEMMPSLQEKEMALVGAPSAAAGGGPMHERTLDRLQSVCRKPFIAVITLAALALARTASASIAYGSLNNFDCVNDTGFEAHGFDIELDDVLTTDITYTYDYNHYGVPKITADLTNPLHPKVLVRYAATWNGSAWSAYTAIPSGPIAPTQGHQFTDPTVNFGGEHFGVGYVKQPSAVKYNWLIDGGGGSLIQGPPVMVSTPTFSYNPPAAGVPAQVVAVIVPPPPPVLPPLQFGAAQWVKSIKTTTHNAGAVRIEDLVADDPGQPQPWANGEPTEVETEWAVLQTDFTAAGGGANGELAGAPEDLPGGDEVITRRYEFYKYVGPKDAETGEAMATAVAADGLHGVGTVSYADHFDFNTGEWVIVTVDLSTVIVVGDFFGAQMAGVDVAPNLGLIAHLQPGEIFTPYPDRTLVVGGATPFVASVTTGVLPTGMTLDPLTGVLSGIPDESGSFTFTVEATDLGGAVVSQSYTLDIAGGIVPVTYLIGTSAFPIAGGGTSGGGVFAAGAAVTVHATANVGHYFLDWTEGGIEVSTAKDYNFTAGANRTLVANFGSDTTPPDTTPTPTGTAGLNGWYLGTVQVSLGATDDASGVANTYYKIDGGAQQSYSASFNVTGDGNHSVDYWSVDNAGNIEAYHTLIVHIDSAAPVISGVSASPSVLTHSRHEMVSVTVSYTVNDLDPSPTCWLTAVSSEPDSGTGKKDVPGDIVIVDANTVSLRNEKSGTGKATRTYTITIHCRDAAGNVSTTTTTVTVT